MQEYEKALKYVRGLLQTEPQNSQAKELERLIDKAMKKGEGRPLCPSASLHSLPSCFPGLQHPQVPFPLYYLLFCPPCLGPLGCLQTMPSGHFLLQLSSFPGPQGPSPQDSRERGMSSAKEQQAVRW